MEYEDLKKFIISTKASKSTIYRFYKKNEDLFSETKKPNGKRLFPSDHARYFDSEMMFDENKVLRQENQSMRNLIDCLADKESLQNTFWQMDCSFFFTVAYKAERNKTSCFKQMHGLYDYLSKKYQDSTELRLFFTTEPFANRSGHHNHFVIHIGNKKLHEQIVTEIQYNQLNLPKKITFGTTGSIEYIYNASGQKLEKIVTVNETVTKTDYLGGFQYNYINYGGPAPEDPAPPIDGTDPVIDPPVENNRSSFAGGQQSGSQSVASRPTLEFFPTAEGYYDNVGQKYVYHYKDHLGNIRLRYDKSLMNQVFMIVDESNYYPFGLKHKGYNMNDFHQEYKYKFQEQEHQDETIGGNQLNLYDYGARNYDPAIGRWMNIDPLAEKGHRWSPYNYAMDNPVFFVDPDGMWPWPSWNSVKQFSKGFVNSAVSMGVHNLFPAVGVYNGAKSVWSIGKDVYHGNYSSAKSKAYNATGIPGTIGTVKRAGKGDAEAIGNLSVIAVSVLATKGSIAATESSIAKGVAATASTEGSITLYRGVNSTSPAYESATKGSATPRGGNATALEHNTVTTESNFTSWTTNPAVAENFALKTSGEGVVLEANIPNSSTVQSPNKHSVQLKQTGEIVSESEVLVTGKITGANVKTVGNN